MLKGYHKYATTYHNGEEIKTDDCDQFDIDIGEDEESEGKDVV